ncbi:MAG TPA: DEAD/DEAH box helicase, partial [archaeon]|nr:DEAD/DEAH box helicase [archaeon]
MVEHPTILKVLERTGYPQLNPAQAAAARSGLLEGKSVVVSAPTASGKTLIAELAALEAIKRRRKVVYLVPLRALASEKYDEFKARYEPLGIRIGMSSGDYDSSDAWLGSMDWVIATSEKMDSLLRHNVPWAQDIGLVVADELHMLNDPDRGPTLEVVLTRLRQIAAPAILGLSATISNAAELAAWLDAELVVSDYRPVPLFYGVAFEREATFRAAGAKNEKGTAAKGAKSKNFTLELASLNHLDELTKHVLKLRKQQLVFVSSRKGAQATAEQLRATVHLSLSTEERAALAALAERARTALEHPTEQCRRLSACIEGGTAFHHAGLAPAQRKLIEAAFRAGSIKAVCATPTLAAGLNLPSYLTIVRDLKRFRAFQGMDYLPVLEIQQMLGRAGRPQYDEQGLGVLLAKSEAEARYAWDNYVTGEPEQIFSKLGVEPVLRTHVLGLVA